MNGNKEPREGLSVKELESFAKQHRIEVFLCLFFFLAGLFSLILWSTAWSIVLATIGAIIGALMPLKIQQFARGVWNFVFRQDRTTMIILAAIALILAIFIAPLVFLLIGLHAGRSIATAAYNASSTGKQEL